MKGLLSFVRSLVGVVGGYALMGLLITMVQEWWFGGVSYRKSATLVLIAAGFLTFLCAVAGGWLAGWIAGRHPVRHGLVMSAMVAAETTWLITSGRTTDPVWFDTMAAGSLVVGLLLGSSLAACCAPSMRRLSRA